VKPLTSPEGTRQEGRERVAQRAILLRPRDELVRILHERGECSVAELAEEMQVSQGSVRRHLDILVTEGLLDTTLVRQPRGRPVTRYSLSEAGEEHSSADHYTRLLERLLPALEELPEEEVSGQPGQAILSRVFSRVAEEVARERSASVRSEELGPRLDEVVATLSDVGILNEVEDEGDSYRLRNVGCPCRSTANESSAPCEADRYSIELLVGAPVEQVATIAEGSGCCEYLVRKPDEVSGSEELPRVELR
jgi:DeoR family suf operon transcriptional repressor